MEIWKAFPKGVCGRDAVHGESKVGEMLRWNQAVLQMNVGQKIYHINERRTKENKNDYGRSSQTLKTQTLPSNTLGLPTEDPHQMKP